MRRALSHRDFRWLWAGQSASTIGDQVSLVAIAALVISAGHGASGLGLVLAGRSAALVLLMIAGGLVADRLPRTLVMRSADAVRVGALVALALLPHEAPLLAFAGLAFVIGGGEAFFQPAYQAVVPSLVPDRDLQPANALTALTRQVAMVIGPGVAGVLLAVFDPRAALWADAATFVVSFATLLAIREPAIEARSEHASITGELREGVTAVIDRPWIGLVILMAMIQLLFVIAPWLVLLPIVASDELGGTDVYGALLAVMGVGAIVGAVVAARWRPRLPGLVSLLALVPPGLALLVLIGPAALPIVGAACLIAGVGEALFEVYWVTGLQRDVPNRLLARVSSLDYVGSLALLPLGFALTGPAVDAFGRDAVLIFGVAVALVTTVPLLFVASVRRFSSAEPLAATAAR
jgi:DHA3 family tetracycline resistance protein-like MFS transporter